MLSLISGFLIKLVLPSVGTAISGFVLRLLQQQLKRVNISLTAEQLAVVKDLILDAVMQVEEIARRVPMSSPDKEAMATSIAQRKMKDLKMPEMTGTEVQKTIDAVLPEVRARLVPSTPATFGR